MVSRAYREASEEFAKINSLVIEGKTTSEGSLVAFCIDWRMCQNWTDVRSKVRSFISKCKRAGLYVAESNYNPFVGIYATRVGKGPVFLRLKHELGLEGTIMYLGDSEFDNPAFRLADISIGVLQVNAPALESKYFIKYDQLERFMAELIKANLDFVPSMAGLHVKR